MSKRKSAPQSAKKGLVVDSSVAIAWCFPDERDTYSLSVLDALVLERAIVPDLWHLEVANTLVVGERRKPQPGRTRSPGWGSCRLYQLRSIRRPRRTRLEMRPILPASAASLFTMLHISNWR